MAELPPEVMERLSALGRVRFVVGDDFDAAPEVSLAPLNKQMFLLVSRGGASEERLLDDPRATLFAEDRAEGWSVRAVGRAVPGRTISAEQRRPELAHWLPDGVSPTALTAVRFYPESVEYIHGRGAARTRIAGPVPGGARPPAATRWTFLATEGIVGWLAAMAVIDWLGLLVLIEDPSRRGALLVTLLLVTGACLLCGVQLVHQFGRFVRWREGHVADEAAGLALSGWEGPRRVRDVGFGMIGFGVLLAVLVSVGAGGQVGGLAVLASGAPLVALFHLARHVGRRRDAAGDVG